MTLFRCPRFPDRLMRLCEDRKRQRSSLKTDRTPIHLRRARGWQKQGHMLQELIARSMLILTEGKPQTQHLKTATKTPGHCQLSSKMACPHLASTHFTITVAIVNCRLVACHHDPLIQVKGSTLAFYG